MSSVFVDVGLSLDGFLAGPNARPGNPLGDGGARIHQWVYPLATFRDRLGLSGGDQNPDDEIVRATFERAGAYVMGRRMFDEGEVGWPERAPFRAPVFVLTHQPRDPWERLGGTTFYFVTEGFDEALRLAREAAGSRDVRVSGGANAIQQALQAGVVDEITIHLAPVVLGSGIRLFEHLTDTTLRLQSSTVVASAGVTHLTYRVNG